MIVLKFGGTSVQNATMMDRALDITSNRINDAPILVASAMAKITDTLIKMSAAAADGDGETALALLEEIMKRHTHVAKEFLTGSNLEEAIRRLETFKQELYSLVKGVSLLKECSKRTLDTILAFGELLSTTLLAYRAKERGIPSEYVDSRLFMRTDDSFSNAAPQMKEIRKLAKKYLKPVPGKIIVCQGFIGSTAEGVTTTLGRGGSDYSATLIGAAIGASSVEIWTDVDGIMTTDPRVIPNARSIPEISYQEAAELAYFGAKVVHPSSIQPAIEQKIPVWVKNTHNPDHPGTVILPDVESSGLRAIAAKKSITLINVVSSRMLNAYGFLSKIFSIFEKHRTPVDLIATSEVSVTMSVDNTSRLKEITHELQQYGEVDVRRSRAIVCLVGKNIWDNGEWFIRAFTALRSIPVKLISYGGSHINLSLVVEEENCEEAIRCLHREFFEH
ncbi:MAG: lysine-sensitive aspartokinase 3 [Spirochaetes bacterium]|nr:lysine-sensitive aspartokinase 3 [Spirochaetota bacterium]